MLWKDFDDALTSDRLDLAFDKYQERGGERVAVLSHYRRLSMGSSLCWALSLKLLSRDTLRVRQLQSRSLSGEEARRQRGLTTSPQYEYANDVRIEGVCVWI